MRESKKTQALILAIRVVCALFLLRAVVVGVYHIRMTEAIYVYQLDCWRTDRDAEVWQADKESFEDTYRRWWDWSDHHILDQYADMRIRPYLGEDVEAWERMVDDG